MKKRHAEHDGKGAPQQPAGRVPDISGINIGWNACLPFRLPGHGHPFTVRHDRLRADFTHGLLQSDVYDTRIGQGSGGRAGQGRGRNRSAGGHTKPWRAIQSSKENPHRHGKNVISHSYALPLKLNRRETLHLP